MSNTYPSSISYSSPLRSLPAIFESSPPKRNNDNTARDTELTQADSAAQNSSPQYTTHNRASRHTYRNRRLTELKDRQPRPLQSSNDHSSPHLPAYTPHTPPTYSDYSPSVTQSNNRSFHFNYSSPGEVPRYRSTAASSVPTSQLTASYHTPHRSTQALYTVSRSGPQHARTLHKNHDYLRPQFASIRSHPTGGMPANWEPKPYNEPNQQEPPAESQSAIFPKLFKSDDPTAWPSKAIPCDRRIKPLPARYGPAFSKASPTAELKYGPPSPPPFERPDTPENELCAVETEMPWGYWAGRLSGLLDAGANTVGMEMGGWTKEVIVMVKEQADQTIRKECMTKEALESYEAFWSVMKLCKES